MPLRKIEEENWIKGKGSGARPSFLDSLNVNFAYRISTFHWTFTDSLIEFIL